MKKSKKIILRIIPVVMLLLVVLANSNVLLADGEGVGIG